MPPPVVIEAMGPARAFPLALNHAGRYAAATGTRSGYGMKHQACSCLAPGSVPCRQLSCHRLRSPESARLRRAAPAVHHGMLQGLDSGCICWSWPLQAVRKPCTQ